MAGFETSTEAFARWHLHVIATRAVKRFGSPMPDVCAGIARHVLTGLNYLERFSLGQFERGDSFNLGSIKDRVRPMNHACALLIIGAIIALAGLHIPTFDMADPLILTCPP
jgi:hypothetical protein